MIIKTVIDTRRVNRTGQYPVKIVLSDKGKWKYISLGIYASPEEFDEASGLFVTSNKKTQKENIRQNNIIMTVLSQLNDLIADCRKNHKAVSSDNIIRMYQQLNSEPAEEEKALTFNSYFKKFIENKKGRTKEIYRTTLKKIEDYFRNELYFENIDKIWIKAFIQKMNKEAIKRKDGIQIGLSLNAQAIHLRNIRAVFNEAINDNITSLDSYPFRNYTIEKEETEHRNISAEELRKVFAFSGTDSENYARDVAKLIFYLIGINASDLFDLKDIRNGYANYRRNKTGRLYSIKLEPEAIELIEKFKGVKSLLCFNEQFMNTANLLKKVNGQTFFKNGKKTFYKRGLNTIGEALGIDGLTTYVLRHTWATIAGKLDVPKDTIGKALGHGKKVVTDIYIDFDQSKIDEANRRVIDYVLNIER